MLHPVIRPDSHSPATMFLGSEDAGTKKVVGNPASELDCDGVDLGHWCSPLAGAAGEGLIPLVSSVAESHGVAGAAVPSAESSL